MNKNKTELCSKMYLQTERDSLISICAADPYVDVKHELWKGQLWGLWNVGMRKNGEKKMDQQCKRRGYFNTSKGRQKLFKYNLKEEG